MFLFLSRQTEATLIAAPGSKKEGKVCQTVWKIRTLDAFLDLSSFLVDTMTDDERRRIFIFPTISYTPSHLSHFFYYFLLLLPLLLVVLRL